MLEKIRNYLSIYAASSNNIRITWTELEAKDVIWALQH